MVDLAHATGVPDGNTETRPPLVRAGMRTHRHLAAARGFLFGSIGWPGRLPALLVLLFVVSLPAVTPRIYAADEVEYFAFLRSLWFDHDLSFDNEYRHFYDSGTVRNTGFYETFLGPDSLTETGRHRTFATVGCALLWAPFYAVADGGVHVARALGADSSADGYSRPYVAAVAYGSAVYGLLALLLSVVACRWIVGRSHAAVPFAMWLGTPLLFYMYVAPGFSHAASAFAVAAFIVTWLAVRGDEAGWSVRGTIALGALAALLAMVREQDVLFAVPVVIDFACSLVLTVRRTDWRRVRAMVASAVAGCVAAGVAYLPQAAAYVVLNGHVGPSRLVTRKMTWTAPHAWQVLASPEHGFIFWTPLSILAIAGLVLLAIGSDRLAGRAPARPQAADVRRVGLCLLLMFGLQVYVAGAIESWTVAGAFGQRRFVGLTLVLALGLAGVFARVRGAHARRAVVVAMVLCAWWNLALMVQFATGSMDRQRLAVRDNAWNAFVVVPRTLPTIAYRYVFDRQSFYARPQPSR